VVSAGIRADILLSPLENHDYNDTQKTALPRVKYGVCMVKSHAPRLTRDKMATHFRPHG
jgi:hypothetical protein